MKKIKTYNQLFEAKRLSTIKKEYDLDDILDKHISNNSKDENNSLITKLLLDLGGNITTDNAMHSFSRMWEVSDYVSHLDLLKNHIDINTKFYVNGIYPDETLLTMVIHRQEKNKIEIAIELLKRGADINATTKKSGKKIWEYLDEDDINELNDGFPGIKEKIERYKKSDDFNL